MRFDFFRRQGAAGGAVATEPAASPFDAADPATEAASAREASSGFVNCAFLLDAQLRVRGYRMGWHAAPGDGSPDESAQFRSLLALVARHFNHGVRGWRLGPLVLFLDVTVDGLFLNELQALPPSNVVLCMGLDDLMDADTRSMLHYLREQGFGIMLRGARSLPEDADLLEVVTHLDVGNGDLALIERLQQRQACGQVPIEPVATRMDDWTQFHACARRHVDVFVDGAHPPPSVTFDSDSLKPESILIVRLLQMIQRNESVKAIESALKRDAALTYRLLRHVNSPAIGVGVEITSLRHAVQMLGYTPLWRWLSLLLTTSNKASSPFMMKRAILRGRFVELIGRDMLPTSEADNLFVVGMFSLIDQLLGITMREVLAKVQLAESVQQAILNREGVYAPFLALVEACETGSSQAAPLAEALFLSAEQVNAAHLSAMAWSQEASAVEHDD